MKKVYDLLTGKQGAMTGVQVALAYVFARFIKLCTLDLCISLYMKCTLVLKKKKDQLMDLIAK